MFSAADRIARSVRTRGFLATTTLIAQGVRSRLRRMYRYWREWRFDRRHGIHTRGLVRGIGDEHSIQYQALYSEAAFFEAMRHLETSGRTFIDLGCGRGKVLYLARDLGFRRIIGVEIDARLCAEARRNAPWAEVVHANAARYDFPSPPLIVYMYNPFDAVVLRQVLRRLQQEEVHIVYQTPQFRGSVEELLEVVAEDESPQGWIIARPRARCTQRPEAF